MTPEQNPENWTWSQWDWKRVRWPVRVFCVLCTVLFIRLVCAEDPPKEWKVLKALDGKEYLQAKLIAADPSGIKIGHAGGVVRIPFDNLSDELKKQFDYDPIKSVDYDRKVSDEARVELGKRVALHAKKAAEANEAARLGRLEWDSVSFRVEAVLSDGLICHRFFPGGPAGSFAQAAGALTGASTYVRPRTDSRAIFLEVLPNAIAVGDLWSGVAARDGAKEARGEVLPRWIVKAGK